jgi:choline dehydrogenase
MRGGPPALEGRYDYVIVGAGTAGCVLANRLSEDPRTRVLLVEAGGSDRYHWVHIPVGYLYCMGNQRTDWRMRTTAEPGLNGRSLAYPLGKLLGGCTSMNGMIYMRGQAGDYDHWRELGNHGWGWEDVLPYFVKSEDYHGGISAFHGAGGEWKVARQRLTWDVLRAVQAGAAELGIMPLEDFNTGDNEGTGFFDVNQHNGWRWNTAKAFLRPARKRPNLRVLTNAPTEQILFEGKRACGVRYRQGTELRDAFADAEVLLAAGAINTPRILELSGVGSPSILAAHGIPVVHHNPAVGENLQDHLQLRTVFKVQGATTLNTIVNSPVGKARIGLEYALKRTGPMSMAPSQFGMFTRSDPSMDRPDLEYHVQPLSTDRLGEPLHPFPAITVSVVNLRPDSVGSTHVVSRDLATQPEIRLNYLTAVRDQEVAVASIRQARRIMNTEALRRYRPEELRPGPDVDSDEELTREAGNIGTTIFHPVGTCRMGDDELAVVGPDLRVHGVDRLRVVDASIMPKIVSGNTASPVVMIAEKAADMILRSSRSGVATS